MLRRLAPRGHKLPRVRRSLVRAGLGEFDGLYNGRRGFGGSVLRRGRLDHGRDRGRNFRPCLGLRSRGGLDFNGAGLHGGLHCRGLGGGGRRGD